MSCKNTWEQLLHTGSIKTSSPERPYALYIHVRKARDIPALLLLHSGLVASVLSV